MKLSGKQAELLGSAIGTFVRAGFIIFCAWKATGNIWMALTIALGFDSLERKVP